MDSERENKSKDCNVKDLQANLFPLFPKMSGYFANYMIKSEPEEDPDEALKLRGSGSRDLFAINRESNYQAQSARWPTECQVLDEKIEHINYVPFVPESYYAASGLENQPKPSGDENGIIVYQYAPISAVNYFSRSSIGGSKFLLSTNICPEENTLKFESRFESGNLARAIRLTPNYYELHLRSDLYTHRYMQWFYFRITNMKKNFLYRFSIVNFTKDGSLYNSGLRPLMYSVKDSQLHSIGWRRCGDQITYFSNENLPEEYEDSQTTYTLTFTILFPHDQDTVYLASCYPYTYTNLQDYLTELSNHPVKSTFTTLRLLCKSLAGNNVNYITITSTPEELEDNKKKRAIVITGRVHPGETPSSWMMKGFIDFLTSDTSAAKELRDKFIFKIVPMLNPDGVIVGNNRCSLSGKDLNRQYRTVMREAYPSIWYTKLMVRRLIEECGVSLYCDLHGHSRKHNIFIYGCENRGRAQDKRLLEQIFPLMLHKNTADKFSFEDCSFRIQKGKEGTGRVVMWMMGITNSYTLEASFAGSTLGNRNRTHFSILDYELMGKSFCQTLLDFYDEEPKKEKLRLKILNRLSQEGSNADEPTNIMLSDYSSDDGSHQSSSEENIGDFNYSNKLITVPPSSPLLICPKAKPRRPKHKLNIKHQENARKPLQMRKASLTLSLSETNFNFCTESSSLDSDEDKSKPVSLKSRRKTHKKKHVKKKTQLLTDVYSYQSISDKESPKASVRSISAFELIPPNNSDVDLTKRSKTPEPRILIEKRNGLDTDLQAVQQRLIAMRNKIWYGVGDGDTCQPISWGPCGIHISESDERISNKHKKRCRRKRHKVKSDKNANKEKAKNDKREKPQLKKTQNGLKRQKAIDIEVPKEKFAVRKSHSLPEVSKKPVNPTSKNDGNGHGIGTKKTTKKKKIKSGKFEKESNLVADTNLVISRS